MKSDQDQSSLSKWLYLLIAIALILRFLYPFFSHPLDHLYSDPDRHYTNITEANFGKSIYSILDAPLPQFWLQAVLFVFGNTAIGIAVYLGLLSMVAPWFWYRWGREIFAKKKYSFNSFCCSCLVTVLDWHIFFLYG